MLSRQRFLALLVILALLFSIMPLSTVLADSVSTVDIEVDQDDLLDIVLTLGSTDSNVSALETDLIAALAAKGVPLDKIKVQAVESNDVAAGNTSSGWEVYDHTNNLATQIQYYRPYYQEVNGNYILDNHLVVSTGDQTNIDFYGYGAPGYKDFMYMPNTEYGKKTFDFTIQEGEFFDALNGAGFLFNTSMSSNSNLESRTMSGYLLFFQYPYGSNPTVYIYKFTDIGVNAFHNSPGTPIQSYSGFVPLAYFSVGAETTRVIKIEASADSLNMTYNGSPVNWTLTGGGATTQTVALPTDFGAYGFGPLVGYTSHGCYLHTHFTFNDVTMSTESSKRFSEVIRGPEWRENSKRFIINAEDGAVADFSDPVALGEILTRLGNEGIHYLGWGKDPADGLAFIDKNDGKGLFVDKTQAATDTYNEQIDALATYIYNQYVDGVINDTDWLIYGNPNAMTITPESEQTNTADANWPDGKWKIVHDENYFENTTGTALYDGLYLSNLDISFVETGKYDIYFKDILTKTVYVHRRPIAGFSVTVSGSGDVQITDNSYDPDHQTAAGKGIQSVAWAYRETSSDTWISGEPSTFAADKNYIIRQTVVDTEGVAGTPYYRYVSTSVSAAAAPIAEFSITPGRLLTYQSEEVSYGDTSYDPQGAAITDRLWTVSRDGVEIYSGAAAKTSFTAVLAGIYKISLKVKNTGNVWSEEAARYLIVVRDSIAPTVGSDTASGNFSTHIMIRITVADEIGGSGFSSRYAVVDQTAAAPSAWGSIGTNPIFQVALVTTGSCYIHVKALDYAGNETVSTFGPYTLTDSQAPSAPTITASPVYTSGDWSKSAVTLTASGSTDDFTAPQNLIYTYSLNGAAFAGGSSVPVSASGTSTVAFKVTDEAGLSSSIVTWTVKVDAALPTIAPTFDLTRIADEISVSVAFADSIAGIQTIRTKKGLDGWQTSDLTGEDPTFASTLRFTVPENGLTAASFIILAEVTDLAGNVRTLAINTLPLFVSEKLKQLPDPDTALNDVILTSQDEIRDTKRLIDLMSNSDKAALPVSLISKLEKLMSSMNILLIIDSKDERSGVMADYIGVSTIIPELSDENVSLVTVELVALPFTQATIPNFVITAGQELDKNMIDLLQTFEIYLLKTITTVDGGQTSGRVSNADITGNIVVRLPLPEEYVGRINLCVAYIADDGSITKLATTLVTLEGKKYLEFVTTHFSTYAIIADSPIAMATTGETGGISLAIVLILIALALTILLRWRLRRRKTSQQN